MGKLSVGVDKGYDLIVKKYRVVFSLVMNLHRSLFFPCPAVMHLLQNKTS